MTKNWFPKQAPTVFYLFSARFEKKNELSHS